MALGDRQPGRCQAQAASHRGVNRISGKALAFDGRRGHRLVDQDLRPRFQTDMLGPRGELPLRVPDPAERDQQLFASRGEPWPARPLPDVATHPVSLIGSICDPITTPIWVMSKTRSRGMRGKDHIYWRLVRSPKTQRTTYVICDLVREALSSPTSAVERVESRLFR